jgi:uncharacterized protein YgiM (DUF1202 family)
MKKYSLFITLLFLSFSVFSISNIYTTHDDTFLRSDKTSASSIIRTLSKDTKLSLLTMHYSGWSQVSLDDLSGWILSNHLTHIAPKSTLVIVDNSDAGQVQVLKETINKLQLENQTLSSKIVDMKVIQDNIKLDINKLEQENNTLSSQNIESKDILDLSSNDSSINTLIILFLGLISGLIVSAIISRMARKKRDSLNTISRSY